MKPLNSLFSDLSLHNIRLFTAFFSLLFSVLAFSTDQLINSDGVLYLNMARAYIEGGLAATASMYNWPFFSILIAVIHQFTGLQLELSGQIINSLLFVVFTDALVLIANKLLSNLRYVFIASLLILCFSTLNDYRSYIIRDIGYWAFISISIYRIIIFLEKPTWQNGIYWQLSILFALLFRIEAVAIMMATPFFILFQFGIKEGIKPALRLCSLFLFGGAMAASIFTQQQGMINAFGKLLSVTQFLDYSRIADEFHSKTTIIGNELLNEYSERYSGMILASGLVYMLLTKIITGLSPLNLILFTFAKFQHKKGSSNDNTRRFLIFFIGINLIILLAFLFKHYFISTRYAVMLITALMILMLPAMCRLIDDYWQAKNKSALILIPFLLLASLIDTFTTSVTKGYIKETAIWASQNLPENSRVLTNDIFIDFYFHENEPKARLKLDRTLQTNKQFDYFIVIEKRSHTETKKQYANWDLIPIHYSENARGDKAVIYKALNIDN
ncbi:MULTISPECIES: hypothetical protein [unclassified Methylophaga]|jgi:hypothetical protein|uniref:hypothetical protein n=1 Tax=unclassified Methylophaga TaxID=2629249 RepID=UPI00259CBF25|nr:MULTISPECIES: hypothetical protein [unclassified Methylophaga]|tara:strand:- start:1937 stop:3436 length:1500 start_codon:yes stop_codon:yes gene_type:complete